MAISESLTAFEPAAPQGKVAAAASAGAESASPGGISLHRSVEALDGGGAAVDPDHTAAERAGVAKLYAAIAGIVPGAVDLTDLDPGEGAR